MLNCTKCATELGLPPDSKACAFPGVGRLLLTPTRASFLLERLVPDSAAEQFLRQAQRLAFCISGRAQNGAAVLHFCCDSPQDQTEAFLETLALALNEFASAAGHTHG